MKLKFHKENIPFAIIMSIILVLIFPIFVTIIFPGVAEAVIPELGECNITYKGKFQPCITWEEAYTINLKFGIIAALITTILVCFYNTNKKDL